MADEIRVSRPAGAPQPRPEYSQAPMSPEPVSGGRSKTPWIILAVVVIVLVLAGVMFRDKLFKKSSSATVKGASTSAYQAVFLTNGQVYFGKISDNSADYVTLKDIYYLQVVQPPLQGQQQPGQPAPATPQPQISLVKLGNELHGPVDEMHISRSQILFYEDLKADGQVVKAIVTDKSKAAEPAK